jgi:predicted amidohydrolase YtcJ
VGLEDVTRKELRGMLIQRATLLDNTVVDIRVAEEIIDVSEHLDPVAGEPVLDAAHHTVIPGLHDHHVHAYSAAAALTSVHIGPREVHGVDDLKGILANAKAGEDGWIRAVGYHEAVAGPLDRAALDAVEARIPVRVQHRTGILWTLNSAGLAAVGLPDHPDGRLRSADQSWSNSLARREPRLADLSRTLASYGVTGITDATPDLGVDGIVRLNEAHRHGELLQRIRCLATAKRILHDDTLDLDELTAWVAARHDAGGVVAVHCVTSAQLVVTIAALHVAGSRSGDRIEHASVVPEDCIADLVGLGVTVVTQPNFVAERGDQYLVDVPPEEHRQLWRVASLLEAGIPVALSTDQPFGGADPWAAMRAAVHRTTHNGAVLGPDERIPAATALEMFFGTFDEPTQPRAITKGQPADLCALAASPAEVLAELASDMVHATVVAGRLVWSRS